jgi:hypothetical protein
VQTHQNSLQQSAKKAADWRFSQYCSSVPAVQHLDILAVETEHTDKRYYFNEKRVETIPIGINL